VGSITGWVSMDGRWAAGRCGTVARAQGGDGARLGTRKEKALPWMGWATLAAQAGWSVGPISPKARREFLSKFK
jgi:hypothetical protein